MTLTLITGGAGFIGSHLAQALLARGEQVRVLDDLSTGDRANLAGLAVEFRLGSVTDPLAVADAVAGCDRVIHLAAAVGVKRILAEPISSITTNIDGTRLVLEACGRDDIPVLVASSSEVYGDSAAASFHEGHHLHLGPSAIHRWSYACSKLLDEFLALAWHRERGLPVLVTRFFNITGPRQSPAYGMVLPRFAAAALAGQPLQVHGDGEQSRCFLHVTDCVRAVLALIDQPAAIGQVVNIGSREEITIGELARRVVDQAGSTSPIAFIPYAQAYPEGGFADMRRRVPDVTRLNQLTGWTPTLDLAATIADALVWARRR
jgi:UDP-glucose 4-epimerase